MKLIAYLIGGIKIEAQDHIGLVQQMKIDCPFPEPSIEDYMKKVKKRVMIFHGKKIIFTTPEDFVEELIRVGEIKMVLIDNEK